ncbi:hypothetical protein D7L56_02725 [Enterococcus faecalis]|nr:hypothetical protein [Enterococcus faecalis]EGO8356182.1 hypothetical protein [Enterococcus faecalis]EGO8406702.1 hypothetical protein [Enterococcus faecalis]EGO8515747.1 hypothetical protein [Enterococcus faecalis]EGO8566372.1 hypothetical protein [Enterococcus faecalis]
MFFNFWIIPAYFRRSCFCSRRLSVFERGAKIQSDFCPTLFFLTHSNSEIQQFIGVCWIF